nr:heavy metal-binding domain-containing protein [Halomonas daqiaonensis]
MACLNELRRKAAEIGTRAVIENDLYYSEISGGGTSMLFPMGSGTAIKVTKG